MIPLNFYSEKDLRDALNTKIQRRKTMEENVHNKLFSPREAKPVSFHLGCGGDELHTEYELYVYFDRVITTRPFKKNYIMAFCSRHEGINPVRQFMKRHSDFFSKLKRKYKSDWLTDKLLSDKE